MPLIGPVGQLLMNLARCWGDMVSVSWVQHLGGLAETSAVGLIETGTGFWVR
jgi:hypothetical protein